MEKVTNSLQRKTEDMGIVKQHDLLPVLLLTKASSCHLKDGTQLFIKSYLNEECLS